MNELPRSPDESGRGIKVIPVKTGIQTPSLQAVSRELIKELDSRFHGKPWIPAQKNAGMTNK